MTTLVNCPGCSTRPRRVAGSVAGVLLSVGVLAAAPAPERLGAPPADWKAFEVADRVRCKMPGEPKKTSQDAAGVRMVMHQCSPGRDAIYAVAWSESDLPAHRKALPTETLLNDSCEGALANMKGSTEESRASVKLGGHPGKKMVVRVPEGRGKAVMCVYYNERSGRLYIAMVGGKGLDADSREVRWFLESLEILEGDRPKK